jgi:hypothetical protein
MHEAHNQNDELRNLDLSSLSFAEFVDFFLAREVVADEDLFGSFLIDLHGEKYFESVPSSPEVLVKYLTGLCKDFAQIAGKYTLAQVDQGIWGMWGPPLSLHECLFNAPMPVTSRFDCIRSMYHVYSDDVAKLEREPDPEIETGIYMWWDLILHGFWNLSRPRIPGTRRGDPNKLDPESRVVLEVLFETLLRILSIPNRPSQLSALHGLGHLDHPGVHDAVQRFIDTNPPRFDLKWLEQCRDCDVL